MEDVVEVLAAGEGTASGSQKGVEHGTELGGELGEFGEGFFHYCGELEEAEGVAGGGGVEDDYFVGEGFDLFEDFGEGHCFVDTRDLCGDFCMLARRFPFLPSKVCTSSWVFVKGNL